MTDQLSALAILFAAVFALNLLPAFAPPTWMALAAVGFTLPEIDPVLVALVGAVAATLGRLALAKLSHWLVRGKLLSDAHRQNIDVIKERLQRRQALTFSVFLFYAFSPLPSNFLFIAYGLTGLPLSRIALPFFVGRSLSYLFWVETGSAAGRRLQDDSFDSAYLTSGYFLLSQVLVLLALYAFTRIDWRALLDEGKLRWLRRGGAEADASAAAERVRSRRSSSVDPRQ